MKELSEGARALCKGKNFAFVATAMADGSPHVSPVWIDVDDEGRLLVNTVIGRLKERNLRSDPRVAVSLVDHEDPYRRIEVRGRVVDWVEGDVAEQHIDELNLRYRGFEPYADHDPAKPRVIAAIVPERVVERL